MMMQSCAGSNHLLYLVDNDHVAPVNLGRHLLNLENLGQNKAKALAAELQRFHPSVQIKAVDADAVASWLLLKNCDIIIDATGDWNVQTNLNELFLEDRGTHLTALLHCWRSEEHTSELQSLMRISYADFHLTNKITKTTN